MINNIILQYSCALLNYGGGIILIKNIDFENAHSKSLDSWWSKIEIYLKKMLSEDDICNYFDFVGNYDDEYLFLFVKSVDHICSLEYSSRLPTDTATFEMTSKSVATILKNQLTKPLGTFKDLPSLPTNFYYGETAENFKQESKQIQFKYLTGNGKKNKILPNRVVEAVGKYITAFANFEGGHILFGIEDDSAIVYGEKLPAYLDEEIVQCLSEKMREIIWSNESTPLIHGKHWDINFFPVIGNPNPKIRRVVIVISICHLPGGVFMNCPISYHIENNEVKLMDFDTWKSKILASVKDVSSNNIINPPDILKQITNEKLLQTMFDVLYLFVGIESYILLLNTWGLHFPPCPINVDIVSIFIISKQGLFLVTISNSEGTDELLEYCCFIGKELKYRLVHWGGFMEKFSIICCVIEASNIFSISSFEKIIKEQLLPSQYEFSLFKINKIFEALAILMASYDPFPISFHGEYYFTLTVDQFELLWKHQFTKEIWIHGPPGSGKTVVLIQMIRELLDRGCQKNEIVYLCENETFCNYIRKFDICLTVRYKSFLFTAKEPLLFNSLYGQVKNIFVDDIQNFKFKHGDWYYLCKNIIQKHQTSHIGGYFWVFMCFEHKFNNFMKGLPFTSCKNSFGLNRITRSPQDYFSSVNKYQHNMKPYFPQSKPCIEHLTTDGKITVISSNPEEIGKTVSEILSDLSMKGYKMKNIAVLLSKEEYLKDFSNHDVTVNTVNNFNSVNKSLIIGVCTELDRDPVNLGSFMTNIISRATNDVIIVTSVYNDICQIIYKNND